MDLAVESPVATADEIRNLRAPDDPGSDDFDPSTYAVGFFDFNAIVTRAADRYEREYPDTIVSAAARRVLVDRALAHEAEVVAAMRQEKLSPADLENAAFRQFETANAARRAHDAPGTRQTLDDAAVEAGMENICWFVGWC